MPTYPRSAYKNLFSSSPSSAKSRGWGNGWPNCQTSKMKTIVAEGGAGGDIRVTVRAEVAAMVRDLLEATDRLYNIKPSSTGAYNCRPIAGTRTASNHSWGLAIDINWNDNPQKRPLHSEIPPKVVEMWQKAGWYWGGFYTRATPDAMHFEYSGKPSDVSKHAKIAASYNKSEPVEPPVVTPPQPSQTTYTVKSGDSLSEIAEKFKVSVEDLVNWNGLKDPDQIAVGQKLRVRSTANDPKPIPPNPSLDLEFDPSLKAWTRHSLVPSLKRALYLVGNFTRPDGNVYTDNYDAKVVEGVADWHRTGGKAYSSGGYDGQIGPKGWDALMAQAKKVKG